MRWPWISRKKVVFMEEQLHVMADALTKLRSEQAQEDRRNTMLQNALKDRDAWAEKYQGLEDQIDARVNAGVDKAVKAIETSFERAAARQ